MHFVHFIRFPSNANDAISLVAAGQADIGLYYQQDVIQARAQQDVPVKSIGAVVQGPLNIVLSLKEKGITSAGDMVGKTIGYAGTDYDTYLDTLSNQKISYAQFDEEYMAKYKENNTYFEDAMKDVEALFGLKLSGDESDRLVLTDYETERLKTAYELSMTEYNADEYTQEQKVLYGEYNPFSVTVTHILNNKSGVNFSSYSHTGLPVAVFADGAGADAFDGYYDNTEIYNQLANMLDVQ